MKKTKILFFIIIFFTAFSLSSQKNQEAYNSPKELYSSFESLKDIYINYCKYNRGTIGSIIKTKVIDVVDRKDFESKLKLTEGKSGYIIYRNLIDFMLYSLYGNGKMAKKTLDRIQSDYSNLNFMQKKAYKNLFKKDVSNNIDSIINSDIIFFSKSSLLHFKNNNYNISLEGIKSRVKKWNLRNLEGKGDFNYKNYNEIILNLKYVIQMAKTGFEKLVNGDLNDLSVLEYKDILSKAANTYSSNENKFVIKDFSVIFSMILFYRDIFKIHPTQNKYNTIDIQTKLNRVIIDYNNLTKLSSGELYPTLNDYKTILNSNLKDFIEIIISNYSFLNKNYNQKEKLLIIDEIDNECNFQIKNSNDDTTNDSPKIIKRNDSLKIIKQKNKFTKEEIDRFIDYKVFKKGRYTSFITSNSDSIIILKNIPDSTTYQEIINFYNAKDNAKLSILKSLLTKNILNVTSGELDFNDLENSFATKYKELYTINLNDFVPNTFVLYNLKNLKIENYIIENSIGISNVYDDVLDIIKITINK